MRKRKRLLAAMLLGAAACAAGACGARKTSDRDLVMVDTADAIELAQGRKKLFGIAGTERGAWIDPRTEREYRAGHIPGALHLPFRDLAEQKLLLRGYDVIVVYGNDYRDPLAEGMSKRLIELGFRDVRTLRGGMRAWRDAGLEIETGPAGGGNRESGGSGP